MSEVGFGTKLEYKDGAGAWTELADIDGDSLEAPNIEWAIAEFKALRTTEFTSRAPGSGNVQPMTFAILWTLAVQTALYALKRQTDIQWRITHPDGTSTETFTGILQTLGRTYRRDNYTMMPVQIAVNGEITLST